jgi:RimJ/RimL family protein N-acetyltransferase
MCGNKNTNTLEIVEITKCIRSEKVTLQFASLENKKLIYDMLVSPEIIDYLFNSDHPAPTWEEFDTTEDNKLFSGSPQPGGSYLLIICNGQVIGSISYFISDSKVNHAELDIWIKETKYTGQGLGTEAINLLMDYIQNRYSVRVFIIRPWIKNINAIKAYKKCGFEEIKNFNAGDYYNKKELEEYGDGDYGADETVNLIRNI